MDRRDEGGFTLMELIIVVALIAIVAALAIPNLLAAKSNANETAAISTLRNLVSAQSQVSVAGQIDSDTDGKGEFGTFVELTGTVPPRRGYTASGGGAPSSVDFSKVAPEAISPPIVSATLAGVNANGFVVKAGYSFKIFLPDSGAVAGFAYESGPAPGVTVAGGTGKFGVDLSETFWCAYAQPQLLGQTGVRRFFTYQRGDILQSANDTARAQGTSALDANSAFLGNGATSAVAVASTGQDGDRWRVMN